MQIKLRTRRKRDKREKSEKSGKETKAKKEEKNYCNKIIRHTGRDGYLDKIF
jgi:hypothetical protein